MNHRNYGIDHHMATVPFEDIQMMRTLHKEGLKPREIADKFEQNIITVRQWLNYRYRAFK